MTVTIPYTYLIGWTKRDKYYYGVRYATNCQPEDLWTTYFTSSKTVKEFVQENGQPDIVEVRKTFDNRNDAILWESKVLRRLNAVEDDRWINRTDNRAIHPDDCSKAMKNRKGSLHPAFGRKNQYLADRNRRTNAERNKERSGTKHHLYGKKGSLHPAFGFSKISNERKIELKEEVICPHCKKQGKRGGMQRWHFDHCKDISQPA